MPTRQEIETEIRANFEAFSKMLPTLLKTNAGKYALLRKQKLVEVFDTPGDARKFAEAQFRDGLYSIQPISDVRIDLGYFSHAMPVSHVQPVNRPSDADSGGAAGHA